MKKPNRNYTKQIVIDLVTKADNREEAENILNDVAHSIHSNGHPYLIGGKHKRRVTMSHISTNTRFIKKSNLQ